VTAPVKSNRILPRSSSATQLTETPPLDTASARFQVAVERAMSRHSTSEWAVLEPRRRTDAIYTELRRLDDAALKSGPRRPKG